MTERRIAMTKNTEVSVVQRNNTLPMTRPVFAEKFVTPFSDIFETPDSFVVMLDMPGALKEAIQVSVERGVLVVKASIAAHHKENATLLFHELTATNYYRVFNLGEGIDTGKIDAQFADGVLTVTLAKSAEAKPREIQIK
jgi:HSP20 family protein